MKTRAEHLKWCKDRALEYVERGELQDAYASFCSDMNKHDETRDHAAIPVDLQLMMIGDLNTREAMKRFIEGFN